jgi:exodeoxyribonuclease V alpha subunit
MATPVAPPVAPHALAYPATTRISLAAVGLLAAFNTAGVLDAADVQVAKRVGRLGGEADERVLLAVALAVRAVRLGSVCVDLAAVNRTVLGEGDELVDVSALPWPEPAAWLAACVAGPLVADGEQAPPGRPLRLVDGLLYLDRYWREEESVRRSLAERAALPAPPVDTARLGADLERSFPEQAATGQRLAVAVGALRRVSVLAGGPGTGKTTTVARLLQALFDQPGPAAAGGAGRADRQGRGPAAGGGGRAAARRAARPHPGGRHPAPAARLVARAPAGSATTAPSGCPSTSSWSTRPRWCR